MTITITITEYDSILNTVYIYTLQIGGITDGALHKALPNSVRGIGLSKGA